jgi:hypothetical protein
VGLVTTMGLTWTRGLKENCTVEMGKNQSS